MGSSSYRQRDPQPMGRQAELSFVILAAAVFAVTWAGLAGLGAASAVFGGGWVWPSGSDQLVAVAGGLLHGHPGHGLPPAGAARVPGLAAVYGCVAAAELVAATLAGAAALAVARYRRPGDARRGMATRHEAAQVLGTRQLRAARPVIRPDLHPAPARKGRLS